MKLVERQKIEALGAWIKQLDLRVVDTYGIAFDCKEYNVENYSDVSYDYCRYSSEYKACSVKKEILKVLKSGKGVYIENAVYFQESLDNELINRNLLYLEDYILNVKRRIDEELSYAKYLKMPYRDYGIIMTQELFYKLGTISREKMEEKAQRYAHDPKGFMDHMELIKSGEIPLSYTLQKEGSSAAC